MNAHLTDLDFAQALSVAEAAAVLFGQKVAEQTGEVPPGTALLHDPQLALNTLQQAGRAAANPRVKAAARHALNAYFGMDVDQHPYLLDRSPLLRPAIPGRARAASH